MRLDVDPNPCLFGWRGGCDLAYTGGHYCDKKAGHAGRHACVCGATRTSSSGVSTDRGTT